MLRKLLLLISLALALFGGVKILSYHRFDEPDRPTMNVSLQTLEHHLRYLKEHGYEIVPLRKVVECIKRGEPLDPKWVVITIDDGYRSLLKALPIFEKYDAPFTLFVYVQAVNEGYGDYLRWHDLRRLAKHYDIEFHSYAHPKLTKLSKNEILQDTLKGLHIFYKNLGYYPRYYAYPYSLYNEEIKELIRYFPFEAAFALNNKEVNASCDPYAINRVMAADFAQFRKLFEK